MARNWLELQTDNPEAAKSFYETAMNWTTVATSLPTYWKFVDSHGEVKAGLAFNTNITGRNDWLSYIFLDEPDAIVTATVANGGSIIVPAHNHPILGRRAVLQDNRGAMFGVFNGDPYT